MTYQLKFKEEALNEWHRQVGHLRTLFKKKLAERLVTPRVPSAKLSGHPDRYKIKLRDAGYRLVYDVRDRDLVIVVVAVGKRERQAV